MQALSRREETEVVDDARNKASVTCDPLIKAFADCSTGRTFSIAWACKDQLKAWRGCMKENMSEDKLDELRLDYIANRSEKGKEAVEKLRLERIASYKRQAGIKD